MARSHSGRVGSRIVSSGVVTLRRCLLAALLVVASLASSAATHTWTGAASANWSDAGNWNPANVPQSGDSLLFPVNIERRVMVNDLPAGRSFTDLLFDDTEYSVSGNALILTHSIVGRATEFDLPIQASGSDVSMTYVTLRGILSGSGRVASNGVTIVGGSHPYSGAISIGDLALVGAALPFASVDNGPVFNNGFLSGDGEVGPVAGNVSLLPYLGATHGVLKTAGIDMAAGLVSVRVAGPTPGIDFRQVVSQGGVQLNPSAADPVRRIARGFVAATYAAAICSDRPTRNRLRSVTPCLRPARSSNRAPGNPGLSCPPTPRPAHAKTAPARPRQSRRGSSRAS